MVNCGKCGVENKGSVKFCKACGTSLATPKSKEVTCLSCSETLYPGAKFCKKCGTASEPDAFSATESLPSPLAVNELNSPSLPESISSIDRKLEFYLDSDPAVSTQNEERAAEILSNISLPIPESLSSQCASCAAPLLPEAKFCKKCGTSVLRGALLTTVSFVPNLGNAEEAFISTEIDPPLAPNLTTKDRIESPNTDFQQKQYALETSSSTDVTSEPSPVSILLVATPSIQSGREPKHMDQVDPIGIIPTAIAEPIVTYKSSMNVSMNPPGEMEIPKSQRNLIVILLLLTIVAASGGCFFWWTNKKTDSLVMPVPLEQVKAEISATPAPIIVNATPLPTPSVSPVASIPTSEPVVTVPPIIAEKPTIKVQQTSLAAPVLAHKELAPTGNKPDQVIKPAQPIRQETHVSVAMPGTDPMAKKITALLAKADSNITSQHFDKAIAMAESVLELEPNSSAAVIMIKKAKAKQMEALKTGSSIE